MRAVVRDVQDFLDETSWRQGRINVTDADGLRAYLLAMLITAGAYDNADDPFGALRHQMNDQYE